MVWRRVAVVVTAAALAVLAGPVPARAAFACPSVPAAGQVVKGVPVEDQVYAPKRLAPLATGAGVRVAVIDSGVAGHPQLRGRVARGRDFLHANPDGRQDCLGHGTAVASIIAAAPADDTGFQGLAPGAIIVPVRISEQEEIDGRTQGERGTPADFAAAIRWAVDQGDAQVINLSVVMTAPDSGVEAAVGHAIRSGVVVVAAAGNHATEGNRTPYPAAYAGVIGVGAIDTAGVRASFSQHGPYVDLVAAGAPVTAAAPGSGHVGNEQGTSFAAPFVSATAALIKERFPDATPAEVARRLTATADPAPGGRHSDDYGFGLLNPYRALTEKLGPDTRPAAVPVVMHPADPAAVALAARRAHARDMAMVFAAVGAGAALLIGAAVVVVRRGRRRGWRPGAPVGS
jgi:membrane-anchored mycosin MYCP